MPTPLRFGRAEIRPGQRQLWLDGRPATLGARGFDLLMALVERRGRTVSKPELLDLVWPGLVVEENNLQVQVSGLRKLLGNDAIATVPGLGYRFTLAADDAGDLIPTPDAAGANLPPASDSVFGRRDDLELLDRMLGEHRLVTVLGAGGVGKTTLALAAAREQAGRGAAVAWVELAPLADAALIPGVIARTMNLPIGPGDPLQALVTSIRPLRALLVLDNAEHLVDAVATVVQALLSGAADVRLLVTSQAALRLDDEWLLQVGPLAVPGSTASVDEALSHGALALFDARARAADRRFVLDAGNLELAIDLCRRLDGLPLAIRLAAARLPLLGLATLHARLAERLDLLGGGSRGAPLRQQTLRATYDWSHGLLAPAEQTMFRRLGVFASSFTLESATSLAGDGTPRWQALDALAALVERSLVMVDDGAPARYRLLDSARSYALDRLETAGERTRLQRRHAQLMGELLEQSIADDRSDLPDREWMRRYPCELDDVRAALAWAAAYDPELALELIAASRTLFRMIGMPQEAWQWTQRLKPFLHADTPPRTRARFADLRAAVGESVMPRADAGDEMPSLADFRRAGDRMGLILALQEGLAADSSSEQRQAHLAEMQGLNDPQWSARMQLTPRIGVAIVDALEDRLEAARDGFQSCVDQARALGKLHLTARLLVQLASVEVDLGAHLQAAAHGREAVALTAAHGSANRQSTLFMLLSVLLDGGDLEGARAVAAQAVEYTRRMGWYRFEPFATRLALFAAMDGRLHSAARLLGLAQATESSGSDALTRRLRERAASLVAARLTDAERREAMSAGCALNPSDACAIALDGRVG